ncbi:hypothetical protein J2X65_003490 [Ancylobacter sp. 3268]|uniref:phage tail-collar fiber domain-containing protein n=1 Tax=Ancylobacter sp. 3268 TaxID=2817752 RepID=UPI0028581366|nr:phage tail protein [Ancylobacter sp. 3268]MDR6954122.1 hypothetical protein [Ancylobacter sp. 3268]
MPQTSFAILTNMGRSREAAALAAGTTVNITHIAIGDGATVPSGGETALYHEVARKTISASGTVVGTSNVAFFDAFLEAAEGPYTIREAGLIDDAGNLIAIAHYDPPINKPIPSSGQTVEGTVRLEVAFSDLANVTIVVDPSMMIALQRLTTLPWIPVVSTTTASPPSSPPIGSTYLIPTGATGAWSGQAGKIAQYTTAGWAIMPPRDGHGIGLPDGRIYMRINGSYVLLAWRTLLTADTTFYVNASTGNDANDGLSPGSAVATITEMVSRLHSRYDLNGFTATVQVADGTYTSGPHVYGPFVGASMARSVIIRGNPSTPANCVVAPGAYASFMAANGAFYKVNGFKVGKTAVDPGTGVDNACIVANGGGTIYMENIDFSTSIDRHINCVNGTVYVDGNYRITGAAGRHISLAHGGMIEHDSSTKTVTITGTPAFSDYFASATGISRMFINNFTFSGAATGIRYFVSTNALIDTSSGDPNYLPGNGAGSSQSGGQYV